MIARRAAVRVRASLPEGTGNFILDALPAADFARLQPLLEVVSLAVKDILHKPDEPAAFAYFPGCGFCSILTVLEDGRMIEVATIGREGAAVPSVIPKYVPTPSATMVQGGMDRCYRLPAAAYRLEMDRRAAFYTVVSRYLQALFGVVMQSSACNAAHSIEQRLAKWLLIASDRMESSQFLLTQEFVAMMLGASRPTVTLVAGMLQKNGLIHYRRGHVTIVNRPMLEAASCECYRVDAALFHSVSLPV